MADGAVAEVDGVDGGGYDGFVFRDNERNEVVVATGEGGGESARHGSDKALKLGLRDAGFSPGGEVNALRGGGDGGRGGDLVSGQRLAGLYGRVAGRAGCRRAGNSRIGLRGDRHNSLY